MRTGRLYIPRTLHALYKFISYVLDMRLLEAQRDMMVIVEAAMRTVVKALCEHAMAVAQLALDDF